MLVHLPFIRCSKTTGLLFIGAYHCTPHSRVFPPKQQAKLRRERVERSNDGVCQCELQVEGGSGEGCPHKHTNHMPPYLQPGSKRGGAIGKVIRCVGRGRCCEADLLSKPARRRRRGGARLTEPQGSHRGEGGAVQLSHRGELGAGAEEGGGRAQGCV